MSFTSFFFKQTAKVFNEDFKRELVLDLRSSIVVVDNKGNRTKFVMAPENKSSKKKLTKSTPPKRAPKKRVNNTGCITPRANRNVLAVKKSSMPNCRVHVKNLSTLEIMAIIAKGLHDGRIRDVKNAIGGMQSE